MNIRVVVVDDDFSSLQAIKNYCGQLEVEVVQAFNSAKEFAGSFQDLNFDIAILDYEMPGYNGLQLAELLNSKNIPVMFVTGHRTEIAAKAWDLNCLACIEKPVTVNKLKDALTKNKPSKRLEQQVVQLELYGGQLANFKVSEIIHIGRCESDTSGNDRLLTLASGKTHRVIKKKMEDFMSVLPNDRFMRIGKSDIVSKDAIMFCSKNLEELTLSTNKKVTISAHRKEDFKHWFFTESPL